MNEKLQYATMLEIPVNTCNITYKPVKKKKTRKRRSDPEEVKRELLEKVNSAAEADAAENYAPEKQPEHEAPEYRPAEAVHTGIPVVTEQPAVRKERKKLTFSVVTAELVIVGVLLAVIFLTGAFYPQSGINAVMQSIFGGNTAEEPVDERLYGEFAPVVNYEGETAPVVENGVMTLPAAGSVYAPCEGEVAAVYTSEDGKYTVEIAHSENFSSVITGLDFVYSQVGDPVYGTIPVGYAGETDFTMCFKGEDGAVITDYTVSDNAVVWAV